MRVLLVTGEFPVRSQSFIVAKALSLARSGLKVELIASRPGDLRAFADVMDRKPANLKVRYAVLVRNSLLSIIIALVKSIVAAVRFPMEATRLFALLHRRKRNWKLSVKQFLKLTPYLGCSADIIHFEFATKAVELEPLLDLVSFKKVVSCRGTDVSILPLLDEKFADGLNRVFQKADRVHCVSKEIQSRAMCYGLKPTKVFINHPAVDVDFFQPHRTHGTSREVPVVVSVGRLHWVKGYEYALQALHFLYKKAIPFRYLIVGDGPAEDAVRFAIWELNLTDVVEVYKNLPQKDVKEKLEEADVFLLTSVSEGLSNTALEAMAMELPIVSSLAGGMAEAITDGIEGFLVKTRSPEMMAEKLELLLNDASLRARMGKAARQRVLRQFRLERQSACFVEEYSKLAGKSSLRQNLPI
jgi:glycosyltransferase involved in cell wall biosynthesis